MNTEQLLALEAFSSDGFLVINKKLLKVFGLQEAVFLSNLIDKLKYFAKVNKLQKDGGFFLTFKQQENQIGLSEHQLRKCKKSLIDKKIIKTYKKGIPSKEFYILDIQQLIDIIEESVCRSRPLKIEGLDPLKSRGLYKETKDKETKERRGKKTPPKKSISDEKLSPVRIRKIVAEYNKIASSCNLSKVQKITDDRIKKIRTRAASFKMYNIRDWKKIFQMIPESDFLCGDNDRNWTITFDWLINSDKNLSKVSEGNFKNRTKKKLPTGMQSWDKYDDIDEIVITDEEE